MSKQHWERYYYAVKNEDWAQAKNSLNTLSSVDGKNPQILLKLGDVCQRTGDTAGAIAAYQRSAAILREQGLIQKALALCKIILRLDPDNEHAAGISRQLLIEMDTARMQEQVRPVAAGEEKKAETGEEVFFGLGRELDKETMEEQVQTLSKDDWVENQDTIHIPPVFESMPPDEIMHLLETSVPQRHSPGTVIISEGDMGNSIYLIQSGKAKVVTRLLGEEIELAALSAGDVFGEVAFLTGRPRTASIVATDKTRVFEFKKFILEDIFEKNPAALEKLHVFYHCRIEDTMKKIKSAIIK